MRMAPGMLLLVGWLAPLQIVLSRGERDDWFGDTFITAMTALAVVCLPLFIWRERRVAASRRPALDLRVYHSRNFILGSVYVVILGMMLYGQMYLLPQFLRNVQHHSAWETGKLQTVNGAAFAVGLIVGGLLMKRVGIRVALAIGAAAFVAGKRPTFSWAKE